MLTKLVAGVLREILEESTPLVGGTSQTIITGITASDAVKSRALAFLILSDLVSVPAITATLTIVDRKLAVVITNNAANTTSATYKLDIALIGSPQQARDFATGVVHVLLNGNTIGTPLATANAPGAMSAASAAQSIDIKCDGDITATLDAAIATLMSGASAKGGHIRLSPGEGTYTGQLVIPDDGAVNPLQRSLRISGAGNWACGSVGTSPDDEWLGPVGGTILDMPYAGGPKIIATGIGKFELDHLTLRDSVDGTQPFTSVTNTVLHAHEVTLVGKTAFVTAQDGFTFGIAALSLGFKNIIENCVFQRIRRGVWGKCYVNTMEVLRNSWATGCGGDSAIVLDTASVGPINGVVIRGNLIEARDYIYPVACTNGVRQCIFENEFFDPTPGATLSLYYFDYASGGNTVIDVFSDNVPLQSGLGTPSNIVIDPNGQNVIPAPLSHSPQMQAAGALTAPNLLYYANGTPQAIIAKADAVATARAIIGVSKEVVGTGVSGHFYPDGLHRILAAASCVPVVGQPAYLSAVTAGRVFSSISASVYPRIVGYFAENAVGGDGMVAVRMRLDDRRDDSDEWLLDTFTPTVDSSERTFTINPALWRELRFELSQIGSATASTALEILPDGVDGGDTHGMYLNGITPAGSTVVGHTVYLGMARLEAADRSSANITLRKASVGWNYEFQYVCNGTPGTSKGFNTCGGWVDFTTYLKWTGGADGFQANRAAIKLFGKPVMS
jgi:hypothetical protein